MFSFLKRKEIDLLTTTIKALTQKLRSLEHEITLLQAQVLELNLKRPVVFSSSAPASGSSITFTAKPAAKKRGRPFGSKNQPKTKAKVKK